MRWSHGEDTDLDEVHRLVHGGDHALYRGAAVAASEVRLLDRDGVFPPLVRLLGVGNLHLLRT